MTPATGISGGIIVAAGLVMLALGAVLLWIGLRGRRISNEPRCRKCKYNLTGATSPVCPECGSDTSETGVVYGERRRVLWAVIPGLLIVLAFLTAVCIGGYREMATVNPYRFYPFGSVLSDAEGGTQKAFDELSRRYDAGKLSTGQIDKVAGAGLRVQAGVVIVGFAQRWIDLLAQMYTSGELSESQRIAYWENLRVYQFEMRSPVRLGDPLPIHEQYTGRGPSGMGPTIRISPTRLTIGDQVVEINGGSCASTGCQIGCSGSCGTRYDLPAVEPGTYAVKYAIDEQVYASMQGMSADDTPLHSREIELTGALVVLPADAADTVTIVDDPTLADDMEAALAIEEPRIEPRSEYAGYAEDSLRLSFRVTAGSGMVQRPSVLLDVAFAVVLIVDGNEIDMGTFAAHAGINSQSRLDVHVPKLDDPVVTIELRPSTKAARTTVDVFEIWGGTVVFEDVRFEPN